MPEWLPDIHLPDGTVRGRTVAYKTPFLQVEVDEETRHQIVRVSDSAALLIYVNNHHEVLMISQVRPALISKRNPSGIAREVIAGRFDYGASVKQLLVNEAKEEAGVLLTEDDIVLLNEGRPLSLSGGALTELQFLGFASIPSSRIEQTDRVYGLAEEREKITREFIPVAELADRAFDTMSAFALVQWFLRSPYAKRQRRKKA